MDNRTQQLADGVWQVEVGYMTNAVVLADDGRGSAEGLTLVDTGGRAGGPRLVRSIRMLGLDPRAVGRVLLTHWHADHAGSAARFARSSAAPQVLCGAEDLDVVRGMEARPMASAPAGWATAAGRAAERLGVLKPAEPVPAASALAPGQVLDVAGGLEVVPAPGHTAGHTAFWLRDHGVLLGGDAVFNTWFAWRGPKTACSALPALPGTLRRLADLDPATLSVAHGPPLLTGVAGRLRRIAERNG